MGHRRIAYIQGNKSAVADRRLAGFCKACMNKGIEVDPALLLAGDYHNPEKTYEMTKELIAMSDRPTCIFMPDDYSSMGGFNAIKDSGLSVPEDISVVGYDGIAYSQLLTPKLTTYLQDTASIGSEAAKQLISLIENPQTTFTEVITIDGHLIEGSSVKKLV